MSERPTHPTTEPDSYDRAEPRKATRNIPPLVWIVLVVVVAWLGIMMFRHNTNQPERAGTPAAASAPADGAQPGNDANHAG